MLKAGKVAGDGLDEIHKALVGDLVIPEVQR